MPDPAHPPHALEQLDREPAIAEKVVVEEVEMLPRQSLDLGQGVVRSLRVVRAAALEERLLVTEVTNVRAPSRHHDRIRNEVEVAPDQIPPDRRNALQRPCDRLVPQLRLLRSEILEESRPRVFTWTQDDGVGMRRRLVGERGHVQPAQHHERPEPSIVIGDLVRAPRARDIHLDGDEVGRVVEREPLDVLVADHGLVVG